MIRKNSIVYIAYNRPELTKLTFEIIKKYKPKEIFLILDGPKKNDLLDQINCNKVKNIVWVSSSTIYQPSNKKIKENNLNLNIDPYPIYQGVGWVYRYLEKLFLYYKKTEKMNIKIIRTSSIYGPFDNFDDNKSHVIPALIKKVFLRKKYLEVWGNKKIVRDFVYVEDLVNTMLRITFNKKILKQLKF